MITSFSFVRFNSVSKLFSNGVKTREMSQISINEVYERLKLLKKNVRLARINAEQREEISRRIHKDVLWNCFVAKGKKKQVEPIFLDDQNRKYFQLIKQRLFLLHVNKSYFVHSFCQKRKEFLHSPTPLLVKISVCLLLLKSREREREKSVLRSVFSITFVTSINALHCVFLPIFEGCQCSFS